MACFIFEVAQRELSCLVHIYGIDFGKNWFHVVAQDFHGNIQWRRLSWTQVPQFVKPYLKFNENDFNDAAADAP